MKRNVLFGLLLALAVLALVVLFIGLFRPHDSGGDITAVYAGTGLTGGGETGVVTLTVAFFGTGTAAAVARSDHHHDAVYVNEGQVDSITSAMIVSGAVTASDLQDGVTLAEITDDDGPGSGLDADLLDGQHSDYYQRLVTGTCATGNAVRIIHADGRVTCEPVTGGAYWSLAGNPGTLPGKNFLGTTDRVSLTLIVSGTAALRLEPTITSPNLIGGYSGNNVAEDVVGATIGGGGRIDLTNQVTANFGTIGGGVSNTAGYTATVGGGQDNIATGNWATVGGGWDNQATANKATVGGGAHNEASSWGATVPGGRYNTAQGHCSFAGGYSSAATLYGQMAYASGCFTATGDAQASLYVVRNAITSTGWTDLYLDGSSTRLTIASGRAMTFDILVVGRSNDAGGNESAGYRITGIIENVGGTTAFIGTPSVTALGEDDAAWGVQVLADDTNDALSVQVRGNGETIRWVATVRTAEVAWLSGGVCW